MKLFALDPLWNELFNDTHGELLKNAGLELEVISEIVPMQEIESLYEGDQDRILLINPDFVGWSITTDDYKNIPNLKGIVLESTSFSYVDTSYADEKGIPVANIRNFVTESVAEWTMMMMLATARKIPLMLKAGFPLNFGSDFITYKGFDLKDKTIGIIGLGNIGSALGALAQGIGMNVKYWSKSTRSASYQYCELDEIFSSCDVVVPVMASNDDTNKLISDKHILSMKNDAIFIAVTHRDYNHDLLLKRVANNELFGYAFEDETPENFNKYDGNVWAAPQYAWTTDNSLRNSMDKSIEAVVSMAKGDIPNKVN
ncbi:MAG: hypothetical protein KBF89_03920 [Acidimicrobiia bacterium]|nr:hypothetical protein [Acidimicrobiia bacterium]